MLAVMRVLVCGGRHYRNAAFVFLTLDRLHRERQFSELMQGGARGADSLARDWALTKSEIVRFQCKADWDKYGNAAGAIRNKRMLEWHPALVVAFPGGKGTADMVRQARAAGVEVIEL